MVLQDYKIDGEYICIKKSELIMLRDHYEEVADIYYQASKLATAERYLGKHSVMCDILKMFEPLIAE